MYKFLNVQIGKVFKFEKCSLKKFSYSKNVQVKKNKKMFNLKKMFKFWKYLDFWKKIKIPDLKKSIPNNKRKSVSVVWYGLVRREITSVRSCNRVRPSAVVCSVVCYRYVRLTSAKLSTSHGIDRVLLKFCIVLLTWAPWPTRTEQITGIRYKQAYT
jgi:hypothetical protein